MFLRALVAVIVLAGIAVTLLSLQDTTPATEEQVDSLRQLGDRATTQMQQRLGQELALKTTSVEQQRLDAPLGQALSRRCIEWTDLNENHPSPENDANRERACGELRAWVRDGREPERPASP